MIASALRWLVFAAFVSLLFAGGALQARYGGGAPSAVVLSPIAPAPAGGIRHVVTRWHELELSRTCEASRCELFLGRGGGFELLASYPESATVAVTSTGSVRVQDADERDGYFERNALLGRYETLRFQLWILAIAFGILLAIMLGHADARFTADEQALETAVRCRVDERGHLVLPDGTELGRPYAVLPPGPALAIHPLPGVEGYRTPASETRWIARAGDADASMRKAARGRGAVRAQLVAAVMSTLATLALVLFG